VRDPATLAGAVAPPPATGAQHRAARRRGLRPFPRFTAGAGTPVYGGAPGDGRGVVEAVVIGAVRWPAARPSSWGTRARMQVLNEIPLNQCWCGSNRPAVGTADAFTREVIATGRRPTEPARLSATREPLERTRNVLRNQRLGMESTTEDDVDRSRVPAIASLRRAIRDRPRSGRVAGPATLTSGCRPSTLRPPIAPGRCSPSRVRPGDGHPGLYPTPGRSSGGGGGGEGGTFKKEGSTESTSSSPIGRGANAVFPTISPSVEMSWWRGRWRRRSHSSAGNPRGGLDVDWD
jgi:hypothetical protein